MDSPSQLDESIEELLEDLQRDAKIPAKQRNSKISVIVEKLCARAYDEGITVSSLDALVDIITLPNELDQASLNSLTRSLYPATKVSNDIVIKLISSLGHGKARPSYGIQSALLKWLVMVYRVLEEPKILSQLYGILFNLLDTVAIRLPLCHVLSLCTRRKHVRPYRIQSLMQLVRQSGNEPALVGLMKVFKDYYPDIVVGDAAAGRASVFTYPNKEWRQRLGEIQAAHLQRTQDGVEQRAFRVTRSKTSAKQDKLVIPEVHTFNSNESSVTLEEIEDVHDFIQRLEKIEPPNQLIAVLSDHLLQYFLQLRSSEAYSQRIDAWLLAFFEDQLQSADQSGTKVLEMLKGIQGYTQFTKILPPACFTYLSAMVHSWNGITGREIILDLLSYTSLGPWNDLYLTIFQTLEEAILEDGTSESRLTILTFYKSLFNNWTVLLLTTPQLPTTSATVTSLVTHANILATVIIQDTPSISNLSTVLSFYETITTLISQPALKNIVRIPIPPAKLIYALLFTQSLNLLSRLCGLLAIYKTSLEDARTTDKNIYPTDYLNHFNGFLMDVCNCVYRMKAFSKTDTNAMGCLMDDETTSILDNYVKKLGNSLSLSSLFSLSFSPILCLLAISSVRKLEDEVYNDIDKRHPGPPTQLSLKQLERDGGLNLSWASYRLGVLMYLEERDVHGIPDLMYSVMKALKTDREKKM